MTPDEGKKLNLPAGKPWWRHSRISGTKDNYAPPPEFSTWYRLESVDLGNPTERYPNGDNIQVVIIWSPPSQFEGVSLENVKQIFDLIRRGPPDMPGEFWMPARQSKAQWVGNAVINVIGDDVDAAASLVASWIKNSVLEQSSYHSPARRQLANRVILNENKAAEILGPLYAEPEPESCPRSPQKVRKTSPADFSLPLKGKQKKSAPKEVRKKSANLRKISPCSPAWQGPLARPPCLGGSRLHPKKTAHHHRGNSGQSWRVLAGLGMPCASTNPSP